jgi:hypothetical protein
MKDGLLPAAFQQHGNGADFVFTLQLLSLWGMAGGH